MTKIEKLDYVDEENRKSIIKAWESGVRATHLFLSEADIERIKPQVLEALGQVSNLVCIRDKDQVIQAFMGVEEAKIEMLFVSDSYRGQGLGSLLIDYGIKELEINYVDVNEDNSQALAFYLGKGFRVFKRSNLDSSGDPFPLLSLVLE